MPRVKKVVPQEENNTTETVTNDVTEIVKDDANTDNAKNDDTNSGGTENTSNHDTESRLHPGIGKFYQDMEIPTSRNMKNYIMRTNSFFSRRTTARDAAIESIHKLYKWSISGSPSSFQECTIYDDKFVIEMIVIQSQISKLMDSDNIRKSKKLIKSLNLHQFLDANIPRDRILFLLKNIDDSIESVTSCCDNFCSHYMHKGKISRFLYTAFSEDIRPESEQMIYNWASDMFDIYMTVINMSQKIENALPLLLKCKFSKKQKHRHAFKKMILQIGELSTISCRLLNVINMMCDRCIEIDGENRLKETDTLLDKPQFGTSFYDVFGNAQRFTNNDIVRAAMSVLEKTVTEPNDTESTKCNEVTLKMEDKICLIIKNMMG